jgi:ABC-type transporter Mla subunit MlaD
MKNRGERMRFIIVPVMACALFMIFALALAEKPDKRTQELNVRMKTELAAYNKTLSEMNRLSGQLKHHQQNFTSLKSEFGKVVTMDQLNKQNLQDSMNKSSQMQQTISNLMKMQNDTLKAIINNLKG